MTDDYVVVADYLKGSQLHTFESLFQMRGFQTLHAATKTFLRHDGQWNADPLSSAQFVTDADWWSVAAPARSSFSIHFGPGADQTCNTLENAPGVLNLDIHSLWPAQHELMLASPPENINVNRQVEFAVRGDGKVITEGKSGIWILGERSIDVPIDGVTSLELETRTGNTNPATLFWANARVVLADGTEVPLSKLPVAADNTQQPKEPGKDFAGGPIKIAGIAYTEAASAQPKNGSKPAILRVDLSVMRPIRFKCVLGGDFPIGDEAQRRKLLAIRSKGAEAHFLTVIEPFESKRQIVRAVAESASSLRVELADGRTQAINITGLDRATSEPRVTIEESRDGQVVRQESTDTTSSNPQP
ncbi:MAG: hypothetical protein QM770_14405 [Tepidisphaeraceae bacterium]